MSIITFLNSSKEQTGKTMALVAIATDMAIEHNKKILIISTTNQKDQIKRCFWNDKELNKTAKLLKNDKSGIDTESGASGLRKNDKK